MTILNGVMTQDHREKIRASAIARRGVSSSFGIGNTPWNKGIKWTRGKNRFPRSEEYRAKQSKAHRGKPSWNKGIRGSASHCWKGGLADLTHMIRSCQPYLDWRASVYKRDGWTCQTCHYRGHGRDIEAHHIIEMHKILKDIKVLDISNAEKFEMALKLPILFDISNGVTLCKGCHTLTYKGKKK